MWAARVENCPLGGEFHGFGKEILIEADYCLDCEVDSVDESLVDGTHWDVLVIVDVYNPPILHFYYFCVKI